MRWQWDGQRVRLGPDSDCFSCLGKHRFFNCAEVGTPNLYIFQGSTVFFFYIWSGKKLNNLAGAKEQWGQSPDTSIVLLTINVFSWSWKKSGQQVLETVRRQDWQDFVVDWVWEMEGSRMTPKSLAGVTWRVAMSLTEADDTEDGQHLVAGMASTALDVLNLLWLWKIQV